MSDQCAGCGWHLAEGSSIYCRSCQAKPVPDVADGSRLVGYRGSGRRRPVARLVPDSGYSEAPAECGLCHVYGGHRSECPDK